MSLFEQSLIWVEQPQTGSSFDDSMDRTSWTDFSREDGEAKRQPYLIDHHVSGCLIWEDLVGGLWLVALGFWFVELEVFQASVWECRQAYMTLEPAQSNGFSN